MNLYCHECDWTWDSERRRSCPICGGYTTKIGTPRQPLLAAGWRMLRIGVFVLAIGWVIWLFAIIVRGCGNPP